MTYQMSLATALAEAREEVQRWDRNELTLADVLNRLVAVLEHPTTEDLLGLLRAHPADPEGGRMTPDDVLRELCSRDPAGFIAALRALRFAGPWTDIGGSWEIRALFDGTTREAGERLAWVVELFSGWMDAAHGGPFRTLAEAQEAAEARLRAAGWALAGDGEGA